MPNKSGLGVPLSVILSDAKNPPLPIAHYPRTGADRGTRFEFNFTHSCLQFREANLTPPAPLSASSLLHDTFLRERSKWAHTGVRPYSTALPVGAEPRVRPANPCLPF